MTEWNARGYESISQLQEAIATEQLSRLPLRADDRVLDVGCGDGRITGAIARRVPRGSVLGIDASQQMITYAQEHHVAPNLSFQVVDVRNLPFQQEFDQIVSFNVIHWIPEQDAVLRSIHAALKPNGRALLRFVPEGPQKCLEDVIEDVCQLPPWSHYFEHHRKPYFHSTPEVYRALAERNGLEVLHLHLEDHTWNFQTREAFVAYCQVTFAEWTRFLPQSDWPTFINTVLDRYRSIAADNPSEANTFKFYQLEVLLMPCPIQAV